MFNLSPLTRSQYLWINRLWIVGFLMWLFGLIFSIHLVIIIGVVFIGIFIITMGLKTYQGKEATWSELFKEFNIKETE